METDIFEGLLNFPESLEVWRSVDGSICVKFQYTYIKEDGFLFDNFGQGKTFYEACANYAKRISGKTLVIESPYSKKRREVIVL